MKSKKGFTLIELLAIIVILAIIAVITVPIILNIIDNSKRGAIKDSAYGYKDSINKFYVAKLVDDPNYSIPDGTYTLVDLDTLGVSVSGDKPDSNSWVYIKKNSVFSACLQFDEYKVDIVDGVVGNAVKGECAELSFPVKIVSGTKGNLQSGDVVRIGDTEEFYVMSSENSLNGKTVLFAKYCLNSSSVQDQNTDFKINFSSSKYWLNENNELISPYSDDGSNFSNYASSPYVYDANSLVYPYVEAYVDYLKSEFGAPDSIVGRLLTYSEQYPHGPLEQEKYASSIGYWSGVAATVQMNYIAYVVFINQANGSHDYQSPTGNSHGIRPVIEIPTSEIR